jgi:hypothetical protein
MWCTRLPALDKFKMWIRGTIASLLYNQLFVTSGLYSFVVLCFLPLLMQVPSYIEDTPLREALDTENSLYRGSSIAQLALLLPIVLDLTIDYLTVISDGARATKCKEGIFATKISRINIVIGCCLISLPSLLPPGTESLAMIYLCCRRSSQMLLNWEYFYSLVQLDPDNWSYHVLLLFGSIMSIGEVLNVFGVNEMAARDGRISSLLVASFVCLYTPVALTTFHILRLLVRGRLLAEPTHQTSFSVTKLPTAETARNVEQEQRNKYNREYLFLHKAYVAVILAVTAMFIVIALVFWRIYSFNDLGLFLHNITVIIFELTTITFTTQNLRFEVYFAMVSVILALIRIACSSGSIHLVK